MTAPDRFAGKVAVITGASRGIGFGIASALVSDGARVCITGRDPVTLAAAATELGGPEVAIGVAGKADNADHRVDVFDKVAAAFGSVDYLVNNAGINPADGGLDAIDLGLARKILEVNLVAPLAWTQLALEAGLRANRGAVVNIGSTAGARPVPALGMYGVSKAALTYLTRVLAVEVGPEVRVNGVAPGVVKTKFAAPLYENREDEVASRYPLRRLGEPEDIAGAVTFLLSESASWITGRMVDVDGGITLL
ncbi:SDR family oxidoreductase [Marmoricola sp. RAF53]|uniref:SDR family oxidoreductase n=1 Tax=Marmoricola sp. RAF53 TaxID=3233059 RepID=UPI003F990D65